MATFRNQAGEVEALPITERTRVSTAAGPVPAWPGDWLIPVQDIYTLCSKATFKQTHEPVDEEARALWQHYYGEEAQP